MGAGCVGARYEWYGTHLEDNGEVAVAVGHLKGAPEGGDEAEHAHTGLEEEERQGGGHFGGNGGQIMPTPAWRKRRGERRCFLGGGDMSTHKKHRNWDIVL